MDKPKLTNPRSLPCPSTMPRNCRPFISHLLSYQKHALTFTYFYYSFYVVKLLLHTNDHVEFYVLVMANNANNNFLELPLIQNAFKSFATSFSNSDFKVNKTHFIVWIIFSLPAAEIT